MEFQIINFYNGFVIVAFASLVIGFIKSGMDQKKAKFKILHAIKSYISDIEAYCHKVNTSNLTESEKDILYNVIHRSGILQSIKMSEVIIGEQDDCDFIARRIEIKYNKKHNLYLQVYNDINQVLLEALSLKMEMPVENVEQGYSSSNEKRMKEAIHLTNKIGLTNVNLEQKNTDCQSKNRNEYSNKKQQDIIVVQAVNQMTKSILNASN